MTSIYSFFAAIIWFNIAILVVAFLNRRLRFLIKYSTASLMLCAGLGIIRMVLPLDFSFAYVICSYTIMPAIRAVLETDIMPGADYLRLSTLILGIWISGIIIVLAITIRRLILERKRCKQYTLVENEQVRRIFIQMRPDKAEILVSPDICVPIVTGIFKAHIFLPNLRLTDSEIELIIAHEYQHFKSHDTLIKLFYLALSALFWWNPIVHKFQDGLDRLLELRCDANVTKKMDAAGKELYLTSILNVIKQLNGVNDEAAPVAAIPLISSKSKSFLEQRFHLVLNDSKPSPTSQIVPLILVILIFLLSYTVIIQPAGFPDGDKDEIGVSITPENSCILILDDGSKKLYVDGEFLWIVSDDMFQDDLHSILPIYERSQP